MRSALLPDGGAMRVFHEVDCINANLFRGVALSVRDNFLILGFQMPIPQTFGLPNLIKHFLRHR